MIERPYHIKDMIALLGLNPRGEGAREIKAQICANRKKGDKSTPLCYTEKFQAWFRSGLRECTQHPYPYVWHIMTGLRCRKCNVSPFYILAPHRPRFAKPL
jgi:hypothetical protein